MSKKINISDKSLVREKVLSGITKCIDLVGMTLGPDGCSVIIERGVGEPLIVDDGRRTMENIKLEDPTEQLVARVLYEVTKKTDEAVGDGTTTSAVLARAILKYIFSNRIKIGGILGGETGIAEIEKELKESLELVCKKLDEIKKEVKTEKDLIDVATVSVGNSELGKSIGEMYWKLGKDGHITLEFNYNEEHTECSVVPGFRFNGGLAKRWMMTDLLRQESNLKESYVFISDQRELKVEDFIPLCQELQNNGRNKLTIVAPKFSDHFCNSAHKTLEVSNFLISCVRAPSLHEEHFKDLAIWTGGKLFTAKDDVKMATRNDLGFVDSISVNAEDGAHLIGGKGDEAEIKKRVEEVRAEMNEQKVNALRMLRQERISALSGGVGLIKIGAPTDEDRNWLKHKVEDAKFATKHAYKAGIVQGGGMTFKKISEDLPKDNILKEALLAPYELLKQNCGSKFTVGKNIMDPVAVSKSALTNAVSAVSKLMRIGGVIATKPEPLLEESFQALIKSLAPKPEANEE